VILLTEEFVRILVSRVIFQDGCGATSFSILNVFRLVCFFGIGESAVFT
jgi:hypothetical protein